MIEVAVTQQSGDWDMLRLGIPTGSQFHRIVTPTGKTSAQADGYMAELLAEYFLGYPVTDFSTEWTDRGNELEPQARAYYAFHRDAEPRACGFVYKDESRMVGCSPDWMIDPDAVGEIKCPMAGKHLMWLADGVLPAAHRIQCQGELWVTERSRLEFMSYYPELPPLIVSVEPDEKIFAAFDKLIPEFIERMLERREQLTALGLEHP